MHIHKKVNIKPVIVCTHEEWEAKRISICISKVRHGQFDSLGSLVNIGFYTRSKSKNINVNAWK